MLEIKAEYDSAQVAIISINVLNIKGQVQAEVKKYKMDYTVLLGRGAKISSDLKITRLPHILIVDQEGIVRASERFLKAEDIKKVLKKILVH